MIIEKMKGHSNMKEGERWKKQVLLYRRNLSTQRYNVNNHWETVEKLSSRRQDERHTQEEPEVCQSAWRRLWGEGGKKEVQISGEEGQQGAFHREAQWQKSWISFKVERLEWWFWSTQLWGHLRQWSCDHWQRPERDRRDLKLYSASTDQEQDKYNEMPTNYCFWQDAKIWVGGQTYAGYEEHQEQNEQTKQGRSS